MNPSDHQIYIAQRRRTIWLAVLGLITSLSIAGYLGWLLLATGFSVKVSPAKAQLTVTVKVIDGIAFAIGEQLYLFSDTMTIAVSADRYQTTTQHISATDASTISITLSPMPGQLMISTQPTNEKTQWQINQQWVHTGSVLTQSLPPGEYQVTIDHPYYQSSHHHFTLESLDTITHEALLTPLSGQLTIDSTPPQATVTLAGELIGKTPLTTTMAGGSRALQITYPGYQTIDDTITLSQTDLTVSRHYHLQPKQATLDIAAIPDDGILLINGQQKALGQHSVNSQQTTTIRYEKAGYFPYHNTFTLAADDSHQIAITLEPEFGEVIINSSPQATIAINGHIVATGHYQATLPAIPHTIEISQSGYRSQVKTIQPSHRRITQLDLPLMTEFEARRAAGEPLFVSTLGITLQRFTMDKITMGSPANEKGRRRHEFAVPVTFRRPVWVSRHEITEAQYRAFDPRMADTALPVSNISWQQAALFCNWLSLQEGLEPVYIVQAQQIIGAHTDRTGYRLPTEAEWEWLAKKAGRATSTVYPWGNNESPPPSIANLADQTLQGQQSFYFNKYRDNFSGKAPVGQFKAERSGLFDITGNVAEWVHDYYSQRRPTNPLYTDYMGPAQGSAHFWKGGHYQIGQLAKLRVAHKTVADTGSPTVGFRIARYD